MGNSTIRLQDIMDGVSSIGDLNPIFDNTGGWGDQPALTIANDVMGELISVRFPWKWNRMKIPAFCLTSYQQDYATPLMNLGWLESAKRIDINNTQVPPPDWPVYAVRDLEESNITAGWPYQVCWLPNDQLEQHLWPGPGVLYTDPLGTTTPPSNPYTNILDPEGNILMLTAWGTTGATEPVAVYPDPDPNNPLTPEQYRASVYGQVIEDGTCEWTVLNPKAQGFRFFPRPPQAGQVWLIRIIGQKKAPTFKTLQQFLHPIPDDYSKWFRDGCVAYAHRYSSNPAVKARFEQMKQNWIAAVEGAAKQGDREDENKGFFPDKGVMAPTNINDPGPYPYRWGWG